MPLIKVSECTILRYLQDPNEFRIEALLWLLIIIIWILSLRVLLLTTNTVTIINVDCLS